MICHVECIHYKYVRNVDLRKPRSMPSAAVTRTPFAKFSAFRVSHLYVTCHVTYISVMYLHEMYSVISRVVLTYIIVRYVYMHSCDVYIHCVCDMTYIIVRSYVYMHSCDAIMYVYITTLQLCMYTSQVHYCNVCDIKGGVGIHHSNVCMCVGIHHSNPCTYIIAMYVV